MFINKINEQSQRMILIKNVLQEWLKHWGEQLFIIGIRKFTEK